MAFHTFICAIGFSTFAFADDIDGSSLLSVRQVVQKRMSCPASHIQTASGGCREVILGPEKSGSSCPNGYRIIGKQDGIEFCHQACDKLQIDGSWRPDTTYQRQPNGCFTRTDTHRKNCHYNIHDESKEMKANWIQITRGLCVALQPTATSQSITVVAETSSTSGSESDGNFYISFPCACKDGGTAPCQVCPAGESCRMCTAEDEDPHLLDLPGDEMNKGSTDTFELDVSKAVDLTRPTIQIMETSHTTDGWQIASFHVATQDGQIVMQQQTPLWIDGDCDSDGSVGVGATSWTSEFTGKYLAGCSQGCRSFGNLEDAKAACKAESSCGGVTLQWGNYQLRSGKDPKSSPSGENSWALQRSQDGSSMNQVGSTCWTSEFTGQYLSACSRGCKSFGNLQDAKVACDAESSCGGVTQKRDNYQLRAGTDPRSSPSGENSWAFQRWSSEFTGKYLAGCSRGCKSFGNLKDAKAACDAESSCGGVTLQGGNYQLRSGRDPRSSPSGEKSWKRGQWTSEFSGKYLAGCSQGCRSFGNLEDAKAACKAESSCGGVTQKRSNYQLRAGKDPRSSPSHENSWARNKAGCTCWTSQFTGMYLGGCSRGCKSFGNLEDAKAACDAESSCGGVTLQRGNYQLRSGTVPRRSPSGENSWKRNQVGCSMTRTTPDISCFLSASWPL